MTELATAVVADWTWGSILLLGVALGAAWMKVRRLEVACDALAKDVAGRAATLDIARLEATLRSHVKENRRDARVAKRERRRMYKRMERHSVALARIAAATNGARSTSRRGRGRGR